MAKTFPKAGGCLRSRKADALEIPIPVSPVKFSKMKVGPYIPLAHTVHVECLVCDRVRGEQSAYPLSHATTQMHRQFK